MADKKENSRADELFEILSEYSDEKPKEVKETLEGESHTEDINNVDEILEILSKGSSRIEPTFEEKEEVADTA